MFDQNFISTSEFESVEKKDERFFCLCHWPKPHFCTLSRLRNYRKTINLIPFPPVSSEAFGIERKKEISFRIASLSQASACHLCLSHVNWCWFGVLCKKKKKKKSNVKWQEAHSIHLKIFQSASWLNHLKSCRLYIAIYSFNIFGLHSMEAHFRHIIKKKKPCFGKSQLWDKKSKLWDTKTLLRVNKVNIMTDGRCLHTWSVV